EVPQRPLALAGLVDGPQAAALVADLDEQRGVRAPGHAPEHLDLAGAQDLEHGVAVRRGRRHGGTAQFSRGQTCPSGSIGRPHRPQSGRPWATSSRANRAKALAWGRVKQNRAMPGGSSPVVSSSSTTTMRSSGSSYFTPIDPTTQANDSGVTVPYPAAGSMSGERSSRRAMRYSPSAATCCFSQRRKTRPSSSPPARKKTRLPGGPSAPGQNTSARGKS